MQLKRFLSAPIFVSLSVTSALAISPSGATPAAAAPPPLPTGVDGVIGSEWNGVTPTLVPFTGDCVGDACGGQLVAFNVYTRADANYLYVAAQALPAAGDRWNDAIVLGNNLLANIYLDTDLKDGSDLLILPGGDDCMGLPGYENPNSTPNPTCNETHFGPLGTSVYYVATGGTPEGPNNSPAGTGGVAEMAISWTVLQNDPDHLGFPLVSCLVNVRLLQAFGNNFSGAQFGATRFGTFSAPSREADANGDIHGKKDGNANFHAHAPKCQNGGTDPSIQSQDPGANMNFQSTQVQTVLINDAINTVTMTGTGLDNGNPVTFTMVATDFGSTGLDTFQLVLSDGYANSGNLLDGTVALQ